MLFIFPAVFLLVGLVLGCGLLLLHRRTRKQVQSITGARPCEPGRPRTGTVKMHGIARALNRKDLLVSPISGQPCVYYRLVIEQFQSSRPRTVATTGRTMSGGSWVPIIEDEQAIPAAIADDTGAVRFDPKQARLDLKASRRHANLFKSLPPELEQSLRDRYKVVTSTRFIPKQMRYTEAVIAQDAEVFAVGDCQVRGGKATLTGGADPLLVSFRSEEDLVRNGKRAAAITAVAGVVVPVLFVALASWMYWSTSARFGPKKQPAVAAKTAPEKADAARDDAVAKLSAADANLSDRARAARKLAELPVAPELVPQVAPHLNPLLESNDRFHRESALLAIQHGWGTAANEPVLQRLLNTARNPKVRDEVAEAIRKVGG